MDQTVHRLHYQAYKPAPFTRADREETTILFGGLHWRAERLIQGAMENLGYRSRVLPTATREDLLTGRELRRFTPVWRRDSQRERERTHLRRELQDARTIQMAAPSPLLGA